MSTSTNKRQASFSGKLDIQKPKNKDVRPREYLADAEVERLMRESMIARIAPVSMQMILSHIAERILSLM